MGSIRSGSMWYVARFIEYKFTSTGVMDNAGRVVYVTMTANNREWLNLCSHPTKENVCYSHLSVEGILICTSGSKLMRKLAAVEEDLLNKNWCAVMMVHGNGWSTVDSCRNNRCLFTKLLPIAAQEHNSCYVMITIYYRPHTVVWGKVMFQFVS